MKPYSGVKKVTLEDHFAEMSLNYKFDEDSEYREDVFYVFFKDVCSETPSYFILEKVNFD